MVYARICIDLGRPYEPFVRGHLCLPPLQRRWARGKVCHLEVQLSAIRAILLELYPIYILHAPQP